MLTTDQLAAHHATVHDAEAKSGNGLTILAERFRSGHGRNGGSTTAAISANGRWGYEKEGARLWAVIDKHEKLPVEFCRSLRLARQHTYRIDHPNTTTDQTATTAAQVTLR